jgi:hypothetical protein
MKMYLESISSDDEWYMIEKMIKQNNANFVIIDSLSRLYEGGIEDSRLAKKVALKLRELCHKLKITHSSTSIIALNKLGKPLTIDSLAGSRMLAQEADFMIGVGKSPEGKRYVKEVAFRYKPEDSENVKMFDIDNNQWIVEGAAISEAALLKESDGRQDDTNSTAILDFIIEKTESITRRSIYQRNDREFCFYKNDVKSHPVQLPGEIGNQGENY